MELRVNAVTIPEAITFNYEELKAELIQKASAYESMVYTPEQIQEAKADRANLNRLKKALNDERIKREREYMAPFDVFKTQISEIISIIDKPAAIIDQQIKAAEERAKEEKLAAIREYFGGLPAVDGFETLQLEQIMDAKWLNASASMKSIQKAIDSRMAQITNDLSVVRSLPAYAFEAEQEYKRTLDLALAVSESHRLQAMAEKKAAFEAEQARLRAAEEAAAIPPDFSNLKPGDRVSFGGAAETAAGIPWGAENIQTVLPAEPVREWVAFQAFMNPEEAKALGQYMRRNGIKYKAV